MSKGKSILYWNDTLCTYTCTCVKEKKLTPFPTQIHICRKSSCTYTCAGTLPAHIYMYMEQENFLHIMCRNSSCQYKYVQEYFLHIYMCRNTAYTYTCVGTLPAHIGNTFCTYRCVHTCVEDFCTYTCTCVGKLTCIYSCTGISPILKYIQNET